MNEIMDQSDELSIEDRLKILSRLLAERRTKQGLREAPTPMVEEERLSRRAESADLHIDVDWLHRNIEATDDTRLYVVLKGPSEKVVLRTTDLAQVREMVDGRLNFRPQTRPRTLCEVPGCTNLGAAKGNTREPFCSAHTYGRCWEPGCRAHGDLHMPKLKEGWFCQGHALSVCRVGSCVEQPATRGWQGPDWVCEWHLAHPGGGFRPDLPGFMYLMERQGEQQFGITNYPHERLSHHRLAGWELVELTPAADGYAVRDLETQVKRWLAKEIGVLPGTTESWSTANLEVTSLRGLVDGAGITRSLLHLGGNSPEAA